LWNNIHRHPVYISVAVLFESMKLNNLRRNKKMKFINLLGYVLALTLSFSSFGTAAADASSPKEKVVFQVSEADPAKWGLALNNAKNVQQMLGADNVDAEIVVYGPGIGMLKLDSTVAARIEEAKKANITIVACENTMKAMKLTKDDMLVNTSFVPAGVVEIMKKQKEGYAYIRP
jgi:uncharacterized protein